LQRWPHLLLVATLAVGLFLDIPSALPGQLLIGAAFWILLFCLLRLSPPADRPALIACLFVSTAGEFFLSLGWGLYTYRLANIPLFVPPGHVFMFLLAAALARRLPDSAALTIAAGAGLYAITVAAAGLDTFALLLFIAFAFTLLAAPRDRRLLASTFVLALLLELYGTGLGVWTWSREVPLLGLVTTNPPGLSGVFYVLRDAMVVAAMALLKRPRLAPVPAPVE
jgi:hypothetical protein